MTCTVCEERMSDYLENTLQPGERATIDLHLRSCPNCGELLRSMMQILEWAKTFPVFAPPEWLATRVLTNTPCVERETWLDTLRGAGRWFVNPRTAMALFTATLVLGWLGNVFGILPATEAALREPSAIYYDAGDLLNRAYDRAVREYYRAPLVTQIQSQIDRLRESSS